MKKLSLLFLSLISLTIVSSSCSNNEKDDQSSSVTIVGKWVFDTYTHTKNGEVSDPFPYDNPECTPKSYLHLKTGNALEEGALDDESCEIVKYTGTWSYQNNILHLVEGTYTADFPVVTLEEKKMVFKIVNPNDTTEFLSVTLLKM